ncbi:IEC3 subunit of the Ino80 complex, chromatin re-modelling-domain-containing protein [Leptodontidium sp. MPI-SDFR-AT-0119]|nr:IEC3 subunit of the Ino80 complex, chromatin re-modelling-domain-containing protein [Leptodontidium sp. MPI-SDFR-AT-0119]
MDANGEENLVVDPDTAMANNGAVVEQNPADAKPTYKSFKKKFRKMKIKFDEAMRQSNDLYLEEQRANKAAKRLAQENDQILDLLLDINNSAQIPVDKRFDLTPEDGILSTIPPLITEEELASAAELQTPEGIALYDEIRALMKEREASLNNASIPPKSLTALIKNTPHTKLDQIPEDQLALLNPIEGQPAPLGFLTAEQLDDYLYDIDAHLGTVPALPPPSPSASHQDLAFGNYHSPYNWLRRNQPHIFLQDGEGSEKSSGKPGALRGAGKRASIPAPSKPDALEIVEEDGQGYDFALGGGATTKGKRKRDDDDNSGGYHPSKAIKATEDGVRKKRPYNRKPKPVDGEAPPPSTKKGKGRAKAKLPTPDPNAHPFGPI